MMNTTSRLTKLISFIFIINVSLSLSACGGGSGGVGGGGSRSSGHTFAYILTSGSELKLFNVDNSTGALTVVANPVQGLGGNPPPNNTAKSITIDAWGDYAYMAHGSSSPEISLYSVNADTGVLTALPSVYQWNSNFSGLEDWSSVAVDPTGTFLFAADTGPDRDATSSFQISDGSNPNEPMGTVKKIWDDNGSYLYKPNKVVFHPDGDLVFILGRTYKFAVATVDTDPQSATYGRFFEVKNSPFDLGSNYTGNYNYINDLVISPNGQFLYLSTSDGSSVNRIYIYAITQTTTTTEDRGNLTLVRYFNTPGRVEALAVGPNGKYLFGADSTNNQILPWKINASSGELTPVDRLPGTAVQDGFATATYPSTLAIDPFGNYLYVGANDGTYVHKIDTSTGEVSQFNAATDVPYGDANPSQIVIRYIAKKQ